MAAHGEHSQRGDEPISVSFAEVIRELRHRPRNTWLELARIDQSSRWRSGAGVLVEEYFAQLPEFRTDDEESMIFICGEMQLRSAFGGAPNLEEYQHRFPELSDQLAIQFSVNKIFDSQEPGQLEQLDSEDFEIDLGLESVGYKLLKEIGRGASGIVYKAQQLSLNRFAAVKVLENPGRDAKRSLRQRQEAELLARLRHPNVVHVYEVLNHRGYVLLIMELIEGPTLRERIDGRPWQSLDAADLVTTLADTVHAVHEAGILHRDLKPSNVLLTLDGQPKISDFGLAKLRADDNFLTTQDSVLGTPGYMSPEQAIGDPAKIGLATDVYSLGAILYELLVGRPPFLGNTVIDTLSMIREREPVAPRDLQPGTPRDLETICLTCLQKSPQSRYLSARDLADDLRRFLKGDAILARQPSLVERLGRSIRRNKVAYSAALAVLVALVSGLCVATWGLIREQSARQRAEIALDKADEAARKSQQVAAFLKDILNGVDPSVALGHDTTMLRHILDSTAQRLGSDLQDEPEVEAELRATIGATYLKLGEYAKAEAMQREALRLRKAKFGENSEPVADSWNDLARVLINTGDTQRLVEAETSVRRALTIRKQQLGNEHRDTALSLYLLGSILYRQGKLGDAELAHRDALAIRKKLPGDARQDIAASLNNLALVLIDEHKYAGAETSLREALDVQKKALREDHPDIADTYLNLANALSRQGKLVDAEAAARESLRIRRKDFGNEHPSVAAPLSRLAGILAKENKAAEADEIYREVLAMQRKLFGNDDPSVAVSLDNYAEVLVGLKRLEDAEARYREALAIRRKTLGNQHSDTLISILKLATVLRDREKLAESEALFRERLASERARVPRNDLRVGNSLTGLVVTLLDAKQFAEAEQPARELMTLTEDTKWYKSPWFSFHAQSLVGASLLGQKKYVEAEPLLIAGYEGMVKHAHPLLTEPEAREKETAQRLVDLYEVTGHPDKALPWKEKARKGDASDSPGR